MTTKSKIVRSKKLRIDTSGKESGISKGRRFVLWGGLTALIALFLVAGTAFMGGIIAPPNAQVLQNQSVASDVYAQNGSLIPFSSVNGATEYSSSGNTSYVMSNATAAQMAASDVGKVIVNLSQSSSTAILPDSVGLQTYPVSGIEHGIVPGRNLKVVAPSIANSLGVNGYDVSGFTVGGGYLFVSALGSTGYGALLIYNMTTLQLVKSITNVTSSHNALDGPVSPVYVSATSTVFYGDSVGSTVSWYNMSTGTQGNISVSQGSLAGGYGPAGLIAYENGIVEVGGYTSTNNLTVINTTSLSVMQNLRMGQEPNAVVADPSAHLLFVANYVSNSVTVVNASKFSTSSHNSLTILKNITVGTEPWSEVYQSGNLYVANTGSSNISIINASTLKVTSSIAISHMWTSSSLSSLAYTGGNLFASSSTTGNVTAINTTTLKFTANLTAGIFSGVIYGYGNYVYDGNYAGNNFSIIGHPTPWAMNLSKSGKSVITSSDFTLDNTSTPAGLYYYANATSPGYFTDHLGILNVTAAMSVNVTFRNVNITENGLPTGTNWTIDWNGTLHRTNLSHMTLSEPNGTYAINGSFINLSSPSGRMGFAPMMNSNVTISGKAVTVNVTYAPMYSLSFNEKGLPKNTEWNVSISMAANVSGHTGTQYLNLSSKLDFIMIPVMNSSTSFDGVLFNVTYSYSIGKVPGYTAAPETGTFNVTGNATVINVTFAKPTYVLTFSETGLPSGMNWTATVNGVLTAGNGSSIAFSEPDGTYNYSLSANGYTAKPFQGNVTISGKAVTVNVTFTKILPLSVNTTITIGFGTSVKNFIPVASVTTNGTSVTFVMESYYLAGTNGSSHFMVEISSPVSMHYVSLHLMGNNGTLSHLGPLGWENIGYVAGGSAILLLVVFAAPWIDIYRERKVK